MTERPSKLAMSSLSSGSTSIDIADVAVIDLLVVVVLDLHHLVAGGEGPAEPLDLALAGAD